MALTSAERIRAYRERQRNADQPDSSRRNAKEHARGFRERANSSGQRRPFTGCDGEGAGSDELGRQNYVLFRMGERELWNGGARLATHELLDFICSHPPDEILVGFAFGYDVTMILRDLPEAQQRRLFEPKVFGEGRSPFVWYRDFDIDYLPRQYLRVRKVKVVRTDDGHEKRVPIKGSTRTIFETFGFFQKSFLKVLQEFGVGTPEQLELIAKSKDARGGDEWQIGETERAYCALECQFLGELMERLREYCTAADIYPYSWNGAGKLAAALHKRHTTITGATVSQVVPRDVLDLANMAYYGGRFEITRVGMIDETVHEYDIRSAYPDQMRNLPCLVHGTWEKATGAELSRHQGLFVSAVKFKGPHLHQPEGQLGALPVRSKEGHLYWPNQGGGVYWSTEIHSAERLGFSIRLLGGWIYRRRCDCKPFDWVEPLFDYRRSIGSSGPGYPIKLGINSLYGKLAQRKGNGRYNNMIWAGIITSGTRAKDNDAILYAGSGNVHMVATDAVYSAVPIPELEVGERLGQWEHKELNGLFIVQPGLYWSPDKTKRKSRGLSGKFFEEPGRTEGFENAWRDYMAGRRSNLDCEFPTVDVPVPGFIGLRLALSRNKPELAGTWISDNRGISFDYRNKRSGDICSGEHIVTGIKPGSPGLVSLPHRDFLAAGGAEPWEQARLMLEEQPDYVDLGIPWKD